MAKARVSINPMYAGGAGGYSFYVRGGEQVVRQRKNNSNYGDTASRSEAQMRRRVKWGNLVNLFKEMKSWQPKAYDGKVKGQTDYNLFMSLNINSTAICLTKDQSRNGCAVMDTYQVSRGSIPPITTVALAGGQKAQTDIKITSAISATRPIGNLSADIIANNPQFRDGDNIAFVAWSQFVDSRNYPYVVSAYLELTLDTSSDTEVGNLELFNFLDSTVSDYITIYPPASSFGTYTHVVAIHTRKGSNLQVSTQNAVALSSAIANQFKGWEWEQECIASYGLDEDVPLDPSFSDGVIRRVTANGSRVTSGMTLSGEQVLRVYGDNLNESNFYCVIGNTRVKPVNKTDEYCEYALVSNAEVTIMLNGVVYIQFTVEGFTVPAELNGYVSSILAEDTSDYTGVSPGSSEDYTLYYDHSTTTSHPLFFIRAGLSAVEALEESDFSVEGGELTRFLYTSARNVAQVFITPTSPSTVVKVKAKGYTIFVGPAAQ